ncbi:helix-turn-helix domain-containing protein [Siphonobacter sp. SORGH_AS_1065]|uniref:helix-turn-helix domain-containing protein n=1 Tax=Siphonobacter sp. SORGH_AS_1065 TaxID=3041795 RepID=UPI00277FAA65|nr:helix-turn-helix transcriptional regulator [Siphonobacter sp. SORGH_AS_1065]MDQ1086987.1 transcriptional regulator with XRE-family HTH domain [Siphonobacter sp. SORGH_AS_1065]
MSLSDKIRAARESQRVSQSELAKRLEIDPPAYHRLEKRGEKLSIEQVEKIASALSMSYIELLTYGETPKGSTDQGEVAKLAEENQRLNQWLKERGELLDTYKGKYTQAVEAVESVIESIYLNTLIKHPDRIETKVTDVDDEGKPKSGYNIRLDCSEETKQEVLEEIVSKHYVRELLNTGLIEKDEYFKPFYDALEKYYYAQKKENALKLGFASAEEWDELDREAKEKGFNDWFVYYKYLAEQNKTSK